MDNRIKSVDADSVAHELGIEAGDRLVAINGKPVVDIMDFLYFMDDDEIDLVIQKPDGEVWELEIEKSFDEVLGLNFENPILDQAQRCSNQCVFCFIDQLPKGMRDTLYFKDDDSRLSFLMGNFVTLTNMNDATFQRLIDYRISPINVSVHTVDGPLRTKLLGNRFAGNILDRLKRLKEAGIEMNGQVVLCPGLNDGAYLDETIEELSHLYPYMFSMAVVPIGLTKYRQGLFEATPVDFKIARAIIKKIEKWQAILLERIGTRFVFAADEFYLKAELDVPQASAYEGYVQIENGVGLLRQFEDTFLEALTLDKGPVIPGSVILGTSVAAEQMIKKCCNQLNALHPQIHIEVVAIENTFFGGAITVAGLLTGKDILRGFEKGIDADALLLPSVLVNTDGVLLDDMTPQDLQEALGIPVHLVDVNGKALVDCLLRRKAL